MSSETPTPQKLDELRDLIRGIEVAFMTTRRPDGMLVTRPMATQEMGPDGHLWFVTNIETHKVDELAADPHVCLGYYNAPTGEWVSVSGLGSISRDRARISELHVPEWRMWFEDEGGDRDGGPDDPRLALIIVEPRTVAYMKSRHSRPRILFEIVRGRITGEMPEIGRKERLSPAELGRAHRER